MDKKAKWKRNSQTKRLHRIVPRAGMPRIPGLNPGFILAQSRIWSLGLA